MKKEPATESGVNSKGGKRPKEGDFVEIKLDENLYAYGRVLESPTVAFYDAIGQRLDQVEILLGKPILFKIWVTKDSFKKPNWKLVGNVPLENELTGRIWFFKKDIISKKLTLYSTHEHKTIEKKATAAQCKGLECAAVWAASHVEGRLKDHYHGTPNKFAVHLNSLLEH